MFMKYQQQRIHYLREEPAISTGPVVYWMSRDQRITDNWAVSLAQEEALARKQPLVVYFCQAKEFLQATPRIFTFMEEGLHHVGRECEKYSVHFHWEEGNVVEKLPAYVATQKASLLLTDFSPLKVKREWERQIANKISCSFWRIDAHNVVPPWITSDKQEYSAKTFRPKFYKSLALLTPEKPKLIPHPFYTSKRNYTEKKSRSPNITSPELALTRFITTLSRYGERNNPLAHATSQLSKYLHFGHLSCATVAEKITELPESVEKEAFLEQLLIRRELAENYCYYNDQYDSFEGFPRWARASLLQHTSDPRQYTYSYDEFDSSQTHEPFWNAIQKELRHTGYLNGYLRMYWAKKILEWSESPQLAQQIAIRLNDTYQFDGRDPNGYTGIAWAIGGVHDRPWFERPVYGYIRYMNESGASRKFSVSEYITRVEKMVVASNEYHI